MINNFPYFQFCIELNWQDFVIGIIWKKSQTVIPQGKPSYALPVCNLFEVWLCLIPFMPLHFQLITKPK